MPSLNRRVAAAILLVAVLACSGAAAGPDEGVLFRASFDKDHLPEKAAGGAEPPFVERDKKRLVIAPGKVGNCIQIARGVQLVYEGQGNAYPAAGTLSFFWRPDDDPKGTGFLILDLSPLERVNYSRFFRVQYGSDTLNVVCFAGPRQSLRADSLRGKFAKDEWHHVALAWDQGRGVALYVDGAPAGRSNEPWTYEGNFNHIGLGVETRPDFRPGGAQFSQSYDELTVYDRWLSDGEIKSLAAGKPPPVGPLQAAAYLARRRDAYGWKDAASVQPVVALAADAAGAGLKQVGIARARDVKRSSWRAFDGERARRWPGGGGYHDGGRALDFELHPGQTFDVVQAVGAGDVNLVQAGNETPLAALTGKDRAAFHLTLAAPAEGAAFRLTRPPQTGGVVHQLNLFQTIPFSADGAGWQRLALTPLTPGMPGTPWPEVTAIRRTCYVTDHEVWLASDAPGKGGGKFPAMRAVQIVGPADAGRRGLAAVALDLAVTASPQPNVLRVDVIDPLNPERYATTADLGIVGASGRLRALLDVRDLVYTPGNRPRIALTFRNETQVNLAESSVSFRWTDAAEALREFGPDQLARARDIFQEISESRPWGYSPNALKTLRLLQNGINTLHDLQPDDEVVSSYWHWINPRAQKAIVKLPEPPPGAPAWAVYLDGAIEACKKVPYWWIANRENSVGEFGANDGINDDTDLVQDWWALHLMRGPDRVLQDSLRRVADNSWVNCMRETGLGHYTDALHTYEDGMNAQCHMALMAYGNPVYMERLFRTVRHYKDLLAVREACGHLHFRGSWYGWNKEGGLALDPKKHGWDDGDNTLALQPGMLVAWYNGNEYCRKTVVDWTDAMMAHSMVNVEKTGQLVGVTLNVVTGEERISDRNVSFGYGFFNAPWAAYEFTGDRKYLDFIRLGIERDLRDYRRVRQTDAVADRYIHETGDCALKERHVAATKQEHLWKSSIHNDNYYELGSFYLAWQCTGDLNFLTEGVKLTYNDITWELPMLTVGEQSTDRVWLPQRLINKVALGGAAMLRNELYPKHGLSWEEATGRIAPMVKSQGTRQFQVWIVNLEDREVSVNARIWRLDHGLYEIVEGPDADQDGAFDGPTRRRQAELARFEILPVTLPARTVWLVACRQARALDDIRLRPDLAVCAEDAVWDAAGGALTVRVHNIGSKPTGPYTVRITMAGKVLLEKQAPSLEDPADCVPRIAEFQVRAGDGQEPVTVELDPGKAIPEITEVNNTVTITPARLPPPWPITYGR